MALIAILATLLAISSQVVIGQLPVAAPAYGIAPPLNAACPDYTTYPPFRSFCDCNLALCFEAAIAAQLEVIATTYNLHRCDVQQWAALTLSTMPSIDYASLTNMVDSMAAAMQREMTRQSLAYAPYPAYCSYFPTDGVIADPILPPAAPVLAKRSPQATAYAAAVGTDFSSYARSTFYQNSMYLLSRALPPMSPLLDAEIRQAIYGYAPLNYLSYADDLDLKMDLNLRAMLSQMYDYTPYLPAVVY